MQSDTTHVAIAAVMLVTLIVEGITHGRSIYLVSQAKLFLICSLSKGGWGGVWC